MSNLSNKFTNIILSQSDAKSLDEIVDSFALLNNLFEQNKLFNFALNSPSATIKEKTEVLKKTMKLYKKPLASIVSNTIIILVKLGKIKILKDIISELESRIYKNKGITVTDIFFASEPTDKQVKIVDEILVKHCKIKPQKNIKIDDSLVAGFVAYFDGKRLDASLHNAFEDLSKLNVE
jgi:ATP synthase F1 delta subunit